MKCEDCDGRGYFYVKRNKKGEIDYLEGEETSETLDCNRCDGVGEIMDLDTELTPHEGALGCTIAIGAFLVVVWLFIELVIWGYNLKHGH